MSPILKGLAIALGAGAVAVGVGEFVSQGPEAVQSKRLDLALAARQAEMLGISAEDAGIEVPANLDRETFQRVVADRLRKAKDGGTCDERRAALAGFMAAEKSLVHLGADIDDYMEPADHELISDTYISAMKNQCLKEAYQECVEKHDFSRLWVLAQGWAGQEEEVGIAEPDKAAEELLDKCLTFELEFESETVLRVPEFTVEIQAKSLVPLSRSELTAETYTFSGENLLTATAQLRPCGMQGPAPKEPFKVQRLTLFADTTGWGALREEARRIAEARRGLQAEVAAEKKEKKTPSPADSARRDRVGKELDRRQKVLNGKVGKRAGTELNRPSRIELDYLPGTISLKLLCGAFVPPIEIGGYYFEWPQHPIYSKYKEGPKLVFERNDIFGGEPFAGKRVQGESGQANVSLTFTLYHRPEKAAIASN